MDMSEVRGVLLKSRTRAITAGKHRKRWRVIFWRSPIPSELIADIAR